MFMLQIRDFVAHWAPFLQNVLSDGTELALATTPSPNAIFLDDWKVLGPFQIGTREAQWGADPLEQHGGFRALTYDPLATFHSSLGYNATVGWSTTTASISSLQSHDLRSSASVAKLNIGFPHIEWSFLQDVYGWAALQWQGWARGQIFVQGSETQLLSLYLEHVLELWIDDQHHFGGDFAGFGRVPLTLRLEPGHHRIDVRLVRDVRVMGGLGLPRVDIQLHLEPAEPALAIVPSPGVKDHGKNQILIADVGPGIEGTFVSPYASVTLRNDYPSDISVVSVNASHNRCEASLVSLTEVKLVSGQTRSMAFEIKCDPSLMRSGSLGLELLYRIGDEEQPKTLQLHTSLKKRKSNDAQKITFLHPSGVVSYAMLKPPTNQVCGNRTLPVMIALHGAGLEADDDLVKHALDPLSDLCAWIVFPTGGTTWSGDDWHSWGLPDVEAAVAAIPLYLETVGWHGPGVDVDQWLVVGHSNGGQGTWYVLTHRSDKVIAAAPLSGYASIQDYVPYTFWRAADPGRMAILHSALMSYNHPLLLENARGIPVLQQHGEKDDNVPPYHSRLLSQRLHQAGAGSEYSEVVGQGHWWDGVMTTDALSAFFRHYTNISTESAISRGSSSFTYVSANPGDTGSKNGVRINQLLVPGRIGKVDISFDQFARTCSLQLTNVASFTLDGIFRQCGGLRVNGQALSSEAFSVGETFTRARDGTYSADRTFPPLPPRHGRQLGALDAILRTQGSFQIVYHSAEAKETALQVSRNLCQYFTADSELTTDFEKARLSAYGNIISVVIGSDLQQVEGGYTHAFQVVGGRLQITNAQGFVQEYPPADGLAAIFLRPLLQGRLELVIWAAEKQGLDIAARLLPIMAGVGQPDFVVVNKDILWKGVDGALALGFFDEHWSVSVNSYVS